MVKPNDLDGQKQHENGSIRQKHKTKAKRLLEAEQQQNKTLFNQTGNSTKDLWSKENARIGPGQWCDNGTGVQTIAK